MKCYVSVPLLFLSLLWIQQTQTLGKALGGGMGEMWECWRSDLLCKQWRDEGKAEGHPDSDCLLLSSTVSPPGPQPHRHSRHVALLMNHNTAPPPLCPPCSNKVGPNQTSSLLRISLTSPAHQNVGNSKLFHPLHFLLNI